MKLAFFFLAGMAIASLTACTKNAETKKTRQYTVNVYQDDIPVEAVVVRLVVWRKSEVAGAADNPADIIFETRTDSSGVAEIPVKRKTSFGVKASKCIGEVMWRGDAWVSRKSEQVHINLEQTDISCR
ncbi:MAG: hypothetical protein ABI644_10320 [Arenimonas sp.]